MAANVCDPGLLDRSSGSAVIGEIVELTLLLPRDHLVILARMAEDRETVVARLLRQAVWDYLVRELRLCDD
jgi:hypothetical protein